jgi:hypothetical protein
LPPYFTSWYPPQQKSTFGDTLLGNVRLCGPRKIFSNCINLKFGVVEISMHGFEARKLSLEIYATVSVLRIEWERTEKEE